MPELDSPIHLRMLRQFRRKRWLPARLLAALARRIDTLRWSEVPGVYGCEWGNPDTCPPLRHVRDHFVTPYVDPAGAAVEVGPGGGRWTRYLLGFGRVYAVDYHQELLDELARNVRARNVVRIRNGGTDFPGIADASIDYLFSFGTFVHLDLGVIGSYLESMKRILKPGASAVVHYADKTKILGRRNEGFSDNTPEQMGALVRGAGLEILEQDTTTLWHSSVIRFGIRS
jgi:SAM-dependent methyltransferase